MADWFDALIVEGDTAHLTPLCVQHVEFALDDDVLLPTAIAHIAFVWIFAYGLAIGALTTLKEITRHGAAG